MGKFSSKSSHFIFSAFCIVLLGTICYYSTIWTPFIWDDQYLVAENAQIKDLNNWPEILTSTIGSEDVEHSYYRPFQMFSYMIDHLFWGNNPVGYHITNILLHCLVAICLLELVWILSLNRWAAFCVPLLFVTHPIHTEAITYISGRADPLAAVAMLMSIGTYIFADKKRPGFQKGFNLLLSVIFFCFALLSKEHALCVPMILILYHISFKTKIRWGALSPLIILSIGYITVRLMGVIIPALELDNPSDTSLMQRVPGAFVAVFSYIRLLIIPINLHMGYGQKTFEFGDSQFIAGASVCIFMMILFFKQRRDYPLMSFAIGWFLVGLLPFLNLIPVNAYMAEHWLYFPSVGYFILLGMFFGYLYRRMRKKWIVEIFFIALLVTQMTLTIRQNQVWKDPIKLYNRILMHNPSYARAHYNLANSLLKDKNDVLGAIEHYQKAVKINPNYADAYNNLGTLYQSENDVARANLYYMKALKVDPMHLDANNNVGAILVEQQQYAEALIYFSRVLQNDENYAKTHNNLGILYARQRKFEKAIEHLTKALELDPTMEDAKRNIEDVQKFIERREKIRR